MVGGSCIAILLAEALLALAGQPRFYRAHSSPDQFAFLSEPVDGQPLQVNLAGGFRFLYDGNPRGYFGPRDDVHHEVNSLGFRGGEFRESKPAGTVRLIFLGDSFMFGEGVRHEDTFPERTRATLQVDSTLEIDAYNLGVGGYNTVQALQLLNLFGLSLTPDVVVLGYVLNDAEPPLFEYAGPERNIVRRPREAAVPEGLSDEQPPETLLYRLRSAQLVWRFLGNRRRTQETIDYYLSLYDESAPGWQESRRALHGIMDTCRAHGIPLVVVLFPILYELSNDYPLLPLHAKLAAEVRAGGATLIDLFPYLKGQSAEALWVHPTDQHPNERVHAIAAGALAEHLRASAILSPPRS